MEKPLFRKVALERLSSPEQMDQLIRVTSPRGWLALLALVLLLTTAIGWGVMGRIPTKVNGQGILVRRGGVRAVFALTAGQVNDLRIEPGSEVKAGDVVASIFRSDENAKTQLSYVFTTSPGRVLEVMVGVGGTVQAGTPIASIESSEGSLEAVIYVPLAEGKKILHGMDVEISPSTVKREESGFMLGKVRQVNEFPSTPQGMMRVLENSKLVERLSGDGTPIEIWADLLPDPTSVSGYQWSSSKGRKATIQRGTVCSVSITVTEHRPISLVIPALKEILGL